MLISLKNQLVISFICLVFLSSCSDEFIFTTNNKNKISFLGIAPQFASIISADHSSSFWPYAYAAGCSVNDVKAELYSFKADGSLTDDFLPHRRYITLSLMKIRRRSFISAVLVSFIVKILVAVRPGVMRENLAQ